MDLNQLRSREIGSGTKIRRRIGQRPEDGRGHRHGRSFDANRDGNFPGRSSPKPLGIEQATNLNPRVYYVYQEFGQA